MSMWFSAIAGYKGGLAHYKIMPENTDLFHAYLERYDGKASNQPPQNMVLARGLHHWSGSTDEQSLLDELGEVIDRRTKGRLYLKTERDYKNQETRDRQP